MLYPKKLEKEIKSKSLMNKNVISNITKYLSINLTDYQQLLCIFCILDKDIQLKTQILNAIQKMSNITLKFSINSMLNSIDSKISSNKYYIIFLFLLQQIRQKKGMNFIDFFSELFAKINSPFKVINSSDLYFHDNFLPSFIIHNDKNNTYNIFSDEPMNNDNQITVFNPFENRKIKLICPQLQQAKLHFEDIFFDHNDYVLHKKMIGRGGYSIVKLATRKKDDVKVAAKIINTNKDDVKKIQINLMRESLLQHKLNHIANAKFIGINFQSFEDPSFFEPTLLFEYYPKGNLSRIIHNANVNVKNKLTPTKKCIIIIGIGHVMNYLHENGIAHRDLKISNVLVDDDLYPKLSDFGLSRFCKNANDDFTDNVGTLRYCAPEIINGEDYDPKSIDVYSFALLVYEIISEQLPYSEFNESFAVVMQRIVLNGCRPSFNDNFTEKMKKLITRCWSGNPRERPTFKKICSLLMNDLSYFKDEEVDQKEVQNYIQKLNKITNLPDHFIMNDIYFDESETDEIFYKSEDYDVTNKLMKLPYVYIVNNKIENTKCLMKIYDNCCINHHYQMVFLRESIIRNKLNHPLMVKFHGINLLASDANIITEYLPSIITEYLPNGSLKDILVTKKVNINSTQKAKILIGLAHFLKYIHQKGIIHGQINPKNILFDENFNPKIKFPHCFSNYNFYKLSLMRYKAPELFVESQNLVFGKDIDVFSYGMVAYGVITGNEPYNEHDNRNFIPIQNKIESSIYPKFPKRNKLTNLIMKCWEFNPNDRPSSDYIFNELISDLSYFEKDTNLSELNNFIAMLRKI